MTQEERWQANDLHMASLEDKEIVKEHAQRRGPGLQAHWDVNHALPAGGAVAAISAWTTSGRNRALGQGLLAEAGKLRENWVRTAKERGLAARKKFKVFKPVARGAPPMAIADMPRALSGEVVEGKTDVTAQLLATGYQGPDLTTSFVEVSGCVSLRSSPGSPFGGS